MNLLIVDDQSVVLDTLMEHFEKDNLSFQKVFTASSAEEARVILQNVPVHILLTDIEMPGEDGIALFRWVIDHYPDIVGIFLTSHADFAYAQEAIRLGGFDYILQPARMEEIDRTLIRAMEEVRKKNRVQHLEETNVRIRNQRDVLMELLIHHAREGNRAEYEKQLSRLTDLFRTDFLSCVFHVVQIKMVRFDRRKNPWDSELLQLVFRNIAEELLAPYGTAVLTARGDFDYYYLLSASEAERMDEEQWKKGMESFTNFINSHMDFRIAVFGEARAVSSYEERLYRKRAENFPGIYWDRKEHSVDEFGDDSLLRVRKAESYIRENLSRSITRAEVAEYLHINEDYFSRIFKKHTGCTFKDYDLRMRMETAKNLLENTRLPISMIATKVGFDNFSHFSQSFKKYTGKTPSEFR